MDGALGLGGGALVVGAIAAIYALLRISTRPVVGQAIAPDAAVALLVAAALLLLGLPALYAVHVTAGGPLALAGHALFSIGLLLLVIVAAGPILEPSQSRPTFEHPLVFGLGIALTVGLLLTGVATFEADVLPRPAAALLLAAMAGFAFVFFVAEFLPPVAGQIGTAVFGVTLMGALAWLGLAISQRPA